MSHIERARAAAALVACTALSAGVLGAQQAAPPQAAPPTVPSSTPSIARPATLAPQGPVAAPAARRSSSAPQGFSVVLVLGDLQGTNVPDDVPVAAKRALTDMREFLPFKSYRLLDAAWLMCCGEPRQGMVSTTGEGMARNIATQMLRGPEEQEYELRLSTSRGEGGRVLVRFTLGGSTGEAGSSTAAASTAAWIRTTQRKIEDLQDRAKLIQTQITEARGKVEVGIAAGGDIPKLEVELRSIQREVRDLEQRIASNTVTRSMQRGGGSTTSERSIRSSIMDTSFSMDVGETVVVGTSRLKGGTKALIALLTAVPPRR
jgi:hypothetical protein